MEILVLFVLKLLDCTFGTLKNIFLFKNKHFWSAFVFMISTYFYLTMVVALTKQNGELAKAVICLATFVGTYAPSKFMDKLEKRHDRLYIFDITATDMESGKSYADNMRKRGLAIRTYKAYDNEMNKILCCKIYCETRLQSKMVKQLIPNDFNFNAFIPDEDSDI